LNATFWFTAGVLTGVTATSVSMPLWRGIGAALASRPRAYLIGAAGIAVFACSAALLYLAIGSPASLQQRSSADSTLAHPVAADSGAGTKALSMDEATARLQTRLERDGGSADEWELLAKSYEFLGRTADASRAREHAASVGPVRKNGTAKNVTAGSAQDPSMPSLADVASLGASAPAVMGQGITPPQSGAGSMPPSADDTQLQAQLEHKVKTHPTDANAWLSLAEIYRRKHDSKEAATAYEKLTALHAMTAQSWADYADVLGGQAGNSLGGSAGRAIDQALTLDPKNPKALWLDASRALQEHRYGDALELWQRLRAVLPADSPDIRLVDANIAEARDLVKGPQIAVEGAADVAAMRAAEAEISGTVTIDGRLASRVGRDATLFIYAKAVDSPGPPLAVVRLTASSWPVRFRLDDSMAMIPARRLSQFQKVIVEARISRSGQATPAAGDLYVTSDVLTPSTGKKLALVINHEIG
jgi:cytochrome c-type biogenesis protein CcmH